MPPVVVGVDLGSSRIKAAAYSPSGQVTGLAAVETPTLTRAGRRDFPATAVVDCVPGLIEALGVPPADIAAVGIATMGEVGTVLRDGRLVALDFPSWHDDRGDAVIARLHDRFDPDWLTGRTAGHTRTMSSLAKLGWLRESGTSVDGMFLTVAAAVLWRLTGIALQSASLAVTSGAFDPVRHEHDTAIWAAAGLDATEHPPVADEAWAPSVAVARSWLALRPGTPVVIAGHDHPVGAVGVGAGPGDVVDSLGSGEPLLTRWRPPSVPSFAQVASMVEGGFSVEGWPGSAALVVIKEGLRPGFGMRTLAAQYPGGRESLEAADGSPGGSPPLAPEVVEHLEQGVVPAGLAVDPDTWTALLDHYARAAVTGEQLLRALTGADGRLIVTGGGLRSTRWLAAKRSARTGADLVVSPIQEAVSRGAAALAGVRVGWWPDAAAMPGVTVHAP